MTEGNEHTCCRETGQHPRGRCRCGGCGCHSTEAETPDAGADPQSRVELEARARELRDQLSNIEEALKEAG